MLELLKFVVENERVNVVNERELASRLVGILVLKQNVLQLSQPPLLSKLLKSLIRIACMAMCKLKYRCTSMAVGSF